MLWHWLVFAGCDGNRRTHTNAGKGLRMQRRAARINFKNEYVDAGNGVANDIWMEEREKRPRVDMDDEYNEPWELP